MLEYFVKWNDWLARHMFIAVLSALFLGLLFPLPDSPALRLLVIGLFAYTTLVTSLGLSFKQFLSVLSRPWVPLWALCLVHLFSPLVAWGIGKVLYPGDLYIRLGYLIGASIPIGVTSIIWTAMTGGNLAVSLVTVTLDTLIVPVLFPLFFKVIVGQTLQLNYTQMLFQLLGMITVPSLLGMALYDWSRGKLAGFAKGFGGFTSKLAFFLVIFINAGVVAPEIHWSLSILKMMLGTCLLVGMGYFLGYAGSYVLKKHSQDIVMAMIYNVGLRNISFGLVLALAYFPPAVAMPITLMMLYQQPFATLIPYVVKWFDLQALKRKAQGESAIRS